MSDEIVVQINPKSQVIREKTKFTMTFDTASGKKDFDATCDTHTLQVTVREAMEHCMDLWQCASNENESESEALAQVEIQEVNDKADEVQPDVDLTYEYEDKNVNFVTKPEPINLNFFWPDTEL